MISFSSANHQIVTSSQLKRCTWCENTFDDYVTYHDVEWGVPVHDDTKHFEFLILEGAQAGLSWATILKKRAGYREAFSNFDVEAVAAYNENTIGYLLAFPGIIKNKLKINGAVNNAKKFIEVQKEWGSFDQYIWSFVGEKPIINHWQHMQEVPARTSESDAFSKDLIKRGFKFVGSITMYAHMQACGLVNDHLTSCFRHQELNVSH